MKSVLVFIILLSVSSGFSHPLEKPSQRLIGKGAQGQDYASYFDFAANRIADFDTEISRSLPSLKLDFIEACGDGDYDDFILVNTHPSSQTLELSFICKIITYGGPIEEKTFNFTWQSEHAKDVNVIALQKREVPGHALTLKAAMKHSIALLASVYLSAQLIQKMYPGEHDKLSHGRVSAGLTAAGSLIGHYLLDYEPSKAVFFGGSMSWLAGLGREVKQGILKNDPNNKNGTWSDIRANTVGVLIASAAMRWSF